MSKLFSARILLSFATVLTAAVLIFGATFAFFSDSETSQNNTLVGGSLDLKIDKTSYYNGHLNEGTTWTINDLTDQLFFNFTDIKPGDLGEDTISFHADNNYWLCAQTALTNNSDNTCTDPELVDDPTCDASPTATTSGELAQNVNFAFWVDDGDNVLETGEKVFKEGTASDILDYHFITLADSTVNNLGGPNGQPAIGGATLYVGKSWCFGTLTKAPLPQDGVNNLVTPANSSGGVTCDGSTINNAAQTDKVLANIKFIAVQSRNNQNFLCEGPEEINFFDDFNDGNIEGWDIIGSHKVHSDFGNWRVVNGELLEDAGGDGYMAFVDNLLLSDQTVETEVKFIGPAGNGAFVIWFQDYNNLVFVSVYPGAGAIWVDEFVNGVSTNTAYPYSINYNDDLWYDFKTKADSTSGDLDVYINNVKIFTHQSVVVNRSGRTGLMNGNSGSYFDDFRLTSH